MMKLIYFTLLLLLDSHPLRFKVGRHPKFDATKLTYNDFTNVSPLVLS